ncbi:MAG: hypothetical protein PSV16_10670 [Flavobacterium sp.]|nr:hypothetical protein [Flavobacterium sp.]
MKALKNILVGFLVSYIGSIPLGYLNIIGFNIYAKSGMASLSAFLLGVVIIEAVVIFSTLIFANKLANNKKIIKYIELFSVFFMLLLAWSFYAGSQSTASETSVFSKYTAYLPFWIGIIASCLNFIQIPFWTGWNLYLINAKHISVENNGKFTYLAGTLTGTFFGMLSLVLFLSAVTNNTDYLSKYLMSAIIPLFFVGMAIYQAYKFWKKYY